MGKGLKKEEEMPFTSVPGRPEREKRWERRVIEKEKREGAEGAVAGGASSQEKF